MAIVPRRGYLYIVGFIHRSVYNNRDSGVEGANIVELVVNAKGTYMDKDQYIQVFFENNLESRVDQNEKIFAQEMWLLRP